MTTLTSSATFTIGDAPTAVAQITVPVLAAPGAGQGRGRIVHPTLGTFDYPYAPDDWTDMDGDAIVRPTWAGARTIGGAANTLWTGKLRDVEVVERWTNQPGLFLPMAFLRTLLSIYQNPPDPAVGQVQWFPSYANDLGFKVAVVGLSVGDADAVRLTRFALTQAWVTEPVVHRLRILDRV